MRPTVLVPAFCPGPALLQTLDDLRSARPDWALVVVDDGHGGDEMTAVFQRLLLELAGTEPPSSGSPD